MSAAPTCDQYGHVPSANPRIDTCLRCRSQIPTQPPGNTRPRNIEQERRIILDAANLAVDANTLIHRAHRRAQGLAGEYVQDWQTVRTDRDRLQDVREELEDAANHLVWQIQDHPTDARIPDWTDVLRGIVLIYSKLR